MREMLSSSEWLIEETTFDIKTFNISETLFTIGNGFMGTRGSLEEGFQGELSGTYLNGVFDAHDSPVIDQVNAPDWLSFVARVDGVRLDVQSCKVVSHKRALDLRQGLLWRQSVFEDSQGRRTRVETLRFAGMSNKNVCGLRVELTAENHTSPVVVESGINGKRYNLERLPAYAGQTDFPHEVKWEKWAKSKHLQEVEKFESSDLIYLEMKTIDTAISIGYAASTTIGTSAKRQVFQNYEEIGERFELDAVKGETLRFDKLVSIFRSESDGRNAVRASCKMALAAAREVGLDALVKLSADAWLRKWSDSDCIVVGDDAATKAARFNIYHLLIAANELDPKANIGAKSLSGEGYRGHVFWDTEIFLLPFFIYTQPETAKSLLLYRYHTLPGARVNALKGKFKGAQYAWESADTGLETTPKWTADGVHRIWTGEEEIHVSADVAYGVLTYVAATGDIEFMLDHGAEILFETSRFWVERLEHNESADRYELTKVIGPDEFHEHVDNNAFTNRMAQWHLVQAAKVHVDLEQRYPKSLSQISKSIGLEPGEVTRWLEIAAKIHIPFDLGKNLIEQFDGYFQLKEVPVVEWDKNDMPCYPKGYNHFNAGETILLKQPDVIMLLYILPDEFSVEVKRENYKYYEARTLHKSSLSPAIHSIMGIEVGDSARALQYFRRSAFVDLTNNQGNTQDGMHIASAGGTWQSLVFGFGGFRVMHGKMTFKPWLPSEWDELRFKLKWHGNSIDVVIGHADAKFTLQAPQDATEQVVVHNQVATLLANIQTVVPYSNAMQAL